MRSIPFVGILGFLFGCCVTVIFALIFIPADEFWPSAYESQPYYIHELTTGYNFSYRPSLTLYNYSTQGNTTFDTEDDYLRWKARMLCYSVEQNADDETHASIILTTWGRHCDHTIMFYTSPRLVDKLPRRSLKSGVIELIYVDPSNSTIGTLLKVLSSRSEAYSWFTYVPSRVFLLPNNLKYYLVSSKLDPKYVVFAGKPNVGKLFGSWEVSAKSPLAMSAAAIGLASQTSRRCGSGNINDLACLIHTTKGQILNLRNSNGDEVISNMVFSNFWPKSNDVKARLKMRFPVGVYVKGSYKKFMDLEYYLHHLSVYGMDPVRGSYTRKHGK